MGRVSLRLVRSVFGSEAAKVVELPWRPGLSIAALVRDHRLPCWTPRTRLAVAIAGRRISADDWRRELADDDHDVVVCPDPTGIDPFTVWINVVLVLSSIVYPLLVGQETSANIPQRRGSRRSPTYAWDRIYTEYRPGLPVPLVFGEHDVGGQVVSAYLAGTLNIVLVLSEGEIESIGGLSGEQNGLLFGTNLRLNGNTISRPLHARMGTISQSPLLPVRFPGVSSALTLTGLVLNTREAQKTTINDTRPISTIACSLYFPRGLYQIDAQGKRTFFSVNYSAWWRPVGTNQKNDVVMKTVSRSIPSGSPFFDFITITPPANITGPIEVHVFRLTSNSDPSTIQSDSSWTSLSYSLNTAFSYPRRAIMAFTALSAPPSGRPQFLARVKGIKVRVFDAGISINPSTTRYWELPPAGDPYNGIWQYPPGSNPAWVAAELLTHPAGLGTAVSDADVDWPAFRDWADFCDQHAPTAAGNEAYMRCDVVVDEAQPAWEYLMRICQTGRAVPVIRGNKISVKYEYASAHGRGSNTVPAKVATQLISSGNVADFQVSYFDTRKRPAVIMGEILNRDKLYAQDVIEVPDPNANIDDPSAMNPLGFTKRSMRMLGITRVTQAQREALFAHDVNRLIGSEIVFRIGVEALAAEVGDVIAVQHDVFRPFDTEAYAYRVETTSNTTSIRLDRPITLDSGTAYQFCVREQDGTITVVTITQGAGTYPADTPISIASSVDVKRSAVVVFGESAKTVKDYQIVNIMLEKSLRRRVRAVEWRPEIHTISSQVIEDFDGGEGFNKTTVTPLVEDLSGLPVTDLAVHSTDVVGLYDIGWRMPSTLEARRSRVYVREVGSSTWELIAETSTPSLSAHSLPVATAIELAVTIQGINGEYQLLEDVTAFGVTTDEFPVLPVPDVQRGEVTVTDDRMVVSWDRLDPSVLDYYEVRSGTRWCGARVLGQTRDPRLCVDFPSTEEGGDNAEVGPILVRARGRHGLFSPRELAIPSPSEDPYAERVEFLDVALDPGATGTHSDTVWASSELRLADDKSQGTWTSAEQTLAHDARLVVLLHHHQRGEDNATVDDWNFAVLSGEALWRCVDGREASPASPGVDPIETVDDLTALIDDLPDDRAVGAYRGEPGAEFSVRVEIRTALLSETLSNQPWRPYKAGWYVLGRAQVRFILVRASLTAQVYVDTPHLRMVA